MIVQLSSSVISSAVGSVGSVQLSVNSSSSVTSAMVSIQGVASVSTHDLFQGGASALRHGLLRSREAGEDTMLLTDVSLFQGRSSTLRCGLV